MVLLGFLFCFCASCLCDFLFACLLAYFGLFSFMGSATGMREEYRGREVNRIGVHDMKIPKIQ